MCLFRYVSVGSSKASYFLGQKTSAWSSVRAGRSCWAPSAASRASVSMMGQVTYEMTIFWGIIIHWFTNYSSYRLPDGTRCTRLLTSFDPGTHMLIVRWNCAKIIREKPGEVMMHPGHPNIQIQSWISGKNVQICSKSPRGYRAAKKKSLGMVTMLFYLRIIL